MAPHRSDTVPAHILMWTEVCSGHLIIWPALPVESN
jgi:hypothetical protein